jgi:hypothetical protein
MTANKRLLADLAAEAAQCAEQDDDPRGWPLDPSPATRRLRLVGALREHSRRRRPGAFPLPEYVQEWFTAPPWAKLIMALPVLAIAVLLGWLAWYGLDEALRQLGMAGIAVLVMAGTAGAWCWFATRQDYR